MATILIVDDRPTNREFLVTPLGYGGHRLLEAADGAEAVGIVKVQHPDLVIADILMPTMDGYEFVRQLRADPAIAHTQVIFFTAHYLELEAQALARACGVCSVLTKPCEPQIVLSAVQAALGLAPVATSPPAAEEFDREHMRLLTDKLSQRANDLRKANERLSALVELGLQLGSERNPHRLLQSFCHGAREIIGARYALACIVDGDGNELRYLLTSGMNAETAARLGSPSPRQGPLRIVLAESRCLRRQNPGGNPVAAGFSSSYPPIHSWLGAPIVSPSAVYGWLGLIDKIGVDAFSDEDERLAGIVAAQVGRIYENGGMYVDVERHAAELEREVDERKRAELRQGILLGVSQALAASGTLREAANKVLRALCESSGWEVAGMWMVDRPANVLRCVDTWHESPFSYREWDELTRQVTFPPGVGMPGRVWLDGQPAWIPDVTKDANFPRAVVAAKEGLRAAFAFPILLGEQILGVVEFFSPHVREPDQDLLRVFTGIGGHLGQFMERKLAEEALRDRDEQVRLLLDSTFEAIYGIDLEGNCTFCNPACLRLLGFAASADLLGKNMHALIHHKRLDGTPYPVEECHINQAFWRSEGTHFDDEVFWRADGTCFPVEYWSYPVRREEKLIGAVVTFLDITQRRQLEDQFRHAQKMEAFGKLAGGVAHDFNNLLTVICGYSELALGRLRVGDPLRDIFDQVRKAGERGTSLTRQLLAFSRKQVLQPVVLDLNALLLDMEKMLHRVIGEDIDLLISPEPPLWPVKADAGQLEQVIMNLIVNGRDAMPQGGKLTIETANVELDETYQSAHPQSLAGQFALVAVSDTGCGMDQATKSRIFEPFFTTKGPEKGTGLGLATVWGIVQQSGGHIEVYSEVGVGTTFKIYLPRIAEGVEIAKATSSISKPIRGTETVLLVEDEEGVRALARLVLQSHGYTVLQANNGSEALITAQQHHGTIHLLVTDVVMPNVSGRQLAERLIPLRPNLKILYLSGYTDDAVVRHGIIEAKTPFLQKPFSPLALARKVREVLDSKSEA
jgi:PAS domain S-box-containing protein